MSASYTLGIDPAKRKFTAALLSPDGQLLVRPADFASDREGFERLLSVLREHVPPRGRLFVGTEATASLDDNFLYWLGSLREDFDIISLRLDPGQVAHFSGARPIRGKTDSADALRIARFTATYGAQLVAYEEDPQTQAMRRLVNERDRLVHERTALRNRLHDRVGISFPELYKVFKSPCLQTPLRLLERCSTARDVARKRPATIARIQVTARAEYIGQERAEKLVALARTSVASATEPSDGETIRFIVRQLIAIEERLACIDKTLNDWIDSAEENPDRFSLPAQIQLLKTIPGVGAQGAATIALRCGNILRYPSPRALAAQLGACPDRHQTGDGTERGRLTHRGDRRSRPTLYLMALMASLADPAFAFHKWRYRQKGQRPKQAVCSLMNKLASIIWAVVHRGQAYRHDQPLKNILTHHRIQWNEFLKEKNMTEKQRQKTPSWALNPA